MSTHVKHSFEPVYNERSRVLVLGSMPSVKSREQGFYYGHPQNRFWSVIANIAANGAAPNVPKTIEEKRALLLASGIAVWDVLASCDIEGSDDSSIRNPEPANIESLLCAAPGIRKVICNGDKAYKMYLKFFAKQADCCGWPQAVKLPSTSPANAAWSLTRLTEAWAAELAPYLFP